MFLNIVYDHTLCMDGYTGSLPALRKKSEFWVPAHWALELKEVALKNLIFLFAFSRVNNGLKYVLEYCI